MLNEKELTMQQVLNFCVPYKDSLSLSYPTIVAMQELETTQDQLDSELCQEILSKHKLLVYNNLSNNVVQNIKLKIASDNVSKKYIAYDYCDLINRYLRYIGISKEQFVFDDEKNIDEQIQQLKKNYLKPLRMFIEQNINNLDIIKERFPMEFLNYMSLLYDKKQEVLGAINVFPGPEQTINRKVNLKFPEYMLKSLRMFSMYIENIINDLDEPILMNLFDKVDKSQLLLYINKLLLEKCKKTDKENNKIDNTIFSIINYVEHKEINGDNTSVKIFNMIRPGEQVSNYFTYTYKDFLIEYKNYISKHPKLKLTKVDLDYFNNYTFDEVNEFINTFFYEDMPTYKGGFIILPNEPTDMLNKKEVVETKEAKKMKVDLLAIQKRSYFSNTKTQPSIRLMGTGEWKNHIIYIYNNGNVVFELFDINSDKFSSKSGAVYVTNVHKLGMFPNLSKRKVIEYIKQNKNGEIFRKYHTSDWQDIISDYIEAPKKYEYDEIYDIVKEQCPNIQEYEDVKHYVKGIS